MHLSENPAESKAETPEARPLARWRTLFRAALEDAEVEIAVGLSFHGPRAELRLQQGADLIDVATFCGRMMHLLQHRLPHLLPAVSR